MSRTRSSRSARRAIFALLLAAVTVLAACGGGGKSAASSDSSTSSSKKSTSSSSKKPTRKTNSSKSTSSSSSASIVACKLFNLEQLNQATGHTFTITDQSQTDKCVVTADDGSTISVGVFQTQGQNDQALQETETACDAGTLTQQTIADGGYSCEITGVPSAGALFKADNVLIAASAVSAGGASSADVQQALIALLQSFEQGSDTSATTAPDTFTAQLTGAQTTTFSGSAFCAGQQLSGSSNVSGMEYDLDDDASSQALFLDVSSNNPTAQTGTVSLFDSNDNIIGDGNVTVSSSTAPALNSPLGFSFSGRITLDAGGSLAFTGTGTCSSVSSQ